MKKKKKKCDNKKVYQTNLKNFIDDINKSKINNIEESDPNKILKNYDKEIVSFIKNNLKEKDFPWVYFKKMIIYLLEELIKPHDYLIENSSINDNEKIQSYIKDKCTLLIAINLIKNIYVSKYDI